MTTAILDTNVIVQSLIGSTRGASSRTLEAYREKRFQSVFSPESLDELDQVLRIPSIHGRSGWSAADFRQFYRFLLANSIVFRDVRAAPIAIPRDATDVMLVNLAFHSNANYLVTNDRRHLLPLRRIGQTLIVTPAKFLPVLNQQDK